MIRIVADDKIPFLKGILEPFASVTYLPGNQITRDVALNADALLIRTRTRCDSMLLEGTPVKFIGTATIGFDHIDTLFCEKNNIKWTNAPGCNSSSVSQYLAAALIRLSSESGFDLHDKTIGIVGVGNVGSKVQNVAKSLGLNVILNDPPRARKERKKIFSTLDELLKESDIVTLHVPLNIDGQDKTFHLINNETFDIMKKGAWLINTSRGEVVDTDALKDACAGEKLTGAVIDVWEKEPEIDIPLMHMAFLATPHIAGYSLDGKANGTAAVVNSLCGFFNFQLKDWYPADLPVPAESEIIIDCNGKTDFEVIKKAVFHSYNILEDDVRLRFDPSRFEKERENYPLRREFQSYKITLKDGTKESRRVLKELGFNVTS